MYQDLAYAKSWRPIIPYISGYGV